MADLQTVQASLVAEHGPAFADGPLPDLIRAVDVFGFHLATLDMRQNSAVHARVVAELLRAAGVADDYEALDEAARVARCWSANWAMRRLLASPFATYGDETRGELATLAAAADVIAPLRPAAIGCLHRLQHHLGLRPAGGLSAAQGGRTVHRRATPRPTRCWPRRCSRPSTTCARAGETMERYLGLPLVRRLLAARRAAWK